MFMFINFNYEHLFNLVLEFLSLSRSISRLFILYDKLNYLMELEKTLHRIQERLLSN